MKSFLLIISFFTRIPIGKWTSYSDEKYAESIKYFPYVGLIIGLFVMLPTLIIRPYNVEIGALFSLIFYLLITGGIHLDGYADTLDGFLSSQPKERIFEIMKDSRVGSFGVIGLIIYFLSLWVGFKHVDPMTLFFMPYVGKLMGSFFCGFTQYAKPSKGMGSVFMEANHQSSSFIHLIIASVLFYLILGWQGLITLCLTIFGSWLIFTWIIKKIGGMTGDTIGFLVEMTQLIFIFMSILTVYMVR